MLKKSIKKFIHSLGLDIVKYYRVPMELERARAINSKQKGAYALKRLTYQNIDLILDVGANAGQFAQRIFEIGYGGNIVSFEPLSSAYEKLIENSKGNKRWQIAERCALGDENGEIQINIAKNSHSSSILPMLQAHIDAEPNSTYVDSETVKGAARFL